MPENARTEFDILDSHGTEYHRWVSDVQITFVRKKFTAATNPPKEKEDQASDEVKAQTLMFLRRHMDKVLNKQCLKYTDPSVLWEALKEQFNNVHDAQLPTLLAEWRSFHLLDFAKVHDYHQAILNLQPDLNVCGKEKTDDAMIENTLETFPEFTSEIAHQYRLDYDAKRIKSFANLMNLPKKKERHHEIILNNNNLRPAGTKRVLESHQANVEMPDANTTIKLKVEDFQTKENEKAGLQALSTPDFE
ncbi:uncharacterized protein LOC126783968 [Argentina anserina]|uniref:uncharacterized protein LOC126783968 n=1 Tax=Argentina anserina TaxID=57926 RepID=UPI00217637A3|nr:uncharacterized protein LOC126783968 [Potentilla anserina]